jgi:hypothetical protein
MSVLLGACVTAREEPGPGVAASAFEELRTLEGRWREAVDNPVETVEHWLTANDTVLVERWGLRSGRESMTLYHMDGRDPSLIIIARRGLNQVSDLLGLKVEVICSAFAAMRIWKRQGERINSNSGLRWTARTLFAAAKFT